ncbi:DUF5916 domain-containing protein [Lysobacter solisilvae (ex Woo and Kim 2020)]|uniref:DUF5916 domain-containing protein n=1 Tax=Agrilutibacter terrestris TaxID=2865112 RepID=A0A7H0FYM2_9GAMM|nr:DUF5916 domain-containing protein [Lysobacter terrestris]QNP41138.1 hypothetical protein H8B22_02615 [Lysobacter terrestris]
MLRATLTTAILAALAAPPALATVEIDGRIDPAEWQGAQHVTDFRQTQPLSRAPASQPTEAWILATEDGLAVAFRNLQSPDIPRTRQQAQRDQGAQADRINLYVDFDGDGRSGYNFTVLLSNSITDTTITNENQFNSDWDGDWRHATSEDEAGWSAEILIPWYIAPMRDVEGTRTLGIQLDRVIGASGERASWPAVSFQDTRFLTALNKVQVPAYSQSLLAITPYVSGVYDNVAHKSDFDTGADIFWKPNGKFQLSATLNPDFGQVESDQLVVNFSAQESFFSDKRPFFTENQGYFDVPFGSLNTSNKLIYTRRVGANADDGSGAGDVTAAVKVNGSLGAMNYGVFAATEADEAGRDFYAVRTSHDGEKQGIGAMVTRVDRPCYGQDVEGCIGREANVYEVDHRWTPNPQWSIRTTLVGSDITGMGTDAFGRRDAGESGSDTGGQVRIDWDMGDGWRQQLYMLHLGDKLQLNDFGFLERNNFNYARYDLAKRFTNLPETSRYSAADWHWATSRRVNDHGLHIADAFAMNRSGQLRDGGNDFFEVASWSSGHDDRILRGNGIVNMPAKYFLFYERNRPRQGDGHWEFYGNTRWASEGLGTPGKSSLQLSFEPTYHVNDRLRFFTSWFFEHNSDWVLWRGDNLLGSYDEDMIQLNAGSVFLINDKQQLRVRLEAIGLDAKAKQAYRVAANGEPLPSAEAIPDVGLRNLGFQVRYRYELAPLSYLYIAYVRGGSFFEEDVLGRYGARDEFADAFSLRDSEQLLVKLSYRFEL